MDAGQVIRWKSCQRWTVICPLAYICLAIAVAVQRRQEAGSDLDAGLIPITVPELLWLLRDTRPVDPDVVPIHGDVIVSEGSGDEVRDGEDVVARKPVSTNCPPPLRPGPASGVAHDRG